MYDERVCGAQNSYTVARVKRATSDQASMVSLGFHITFLVQKMDIYRRSSFSRCAKSDDGGDRDHEGRRLHRIRYLGNVMLRLLSKRS